MNKLNRPQPPIAISRESSASDSGRTVTSSVSPELISEAVIASYIHDISTRHSRGAVRNRSRPEAGERR